MNTCTKSVKTIRSRWALISAVLLAGIPAFAAASAPAVSNLRAETRAGQVFLTWSEAETPEGTTFNVYLLDRPITEQRLAQARRVGFRIPRHSARNWWLDPASFYAPRNMPEAPAPEPEGFRIRSDGEPLDPASGLFVHTFVEGGPTLAYFAVTQTGPDGVENRILVPGANTTTEGVRTRVELIQPIAWRPGARLP